jgi:cytochrome c biogenesis protein CcmG/thiol:disulfide interchange protein DsbE
MRAALCVLALIVGAPAAALEQGARAPALSAPRLDQPGQALALQSFKGRVVYVDFWASWCVPCRLSMPALDTLYRKHAPRGFAVVGFNKDVSPADAQRFLARVPVTFALAQDGDDAAARAFDVKAMPSGYLIDRRGVIRRVHRGFTAETAASLEREIEELLGEAD